jgi:hypothetical protein
VHDLIELEVELLEAVAEYEATNGRGIDRATLRNKFDLDFPDFVRVLYYLRGCGYIILERVTSDASQLVLLTHAGAARLEAERVARLPTVKPGARSRLSDLSE